ncbi:MAG: hypothetical protein P8I74_03040 [Phycisphaerales bacterium]|nr:hypothetical protein [Phycisphaerales bacterium]
MKNNRTNSALNPLTVSIGAIAIIVIFLIMMTPSLYRSGSTVLIAAPESDDSMEKLMARHEANSTTDVERFNGRSLFFTPPINRKPPPPPPPAPPKVEVEEKPPPPPPPPSFPPNYTGPELVAILGEEAWFKERSSDNDPLTRLGIGDDHEDIDVLATDPPRGITVNYQGGGPYEVAFIDMESTPFSANATTIDMPRGILEDVADDAGLDETPPLGTAEACERFWRRSNAELGFLNQYEPMVAVQKRIDVYQAWIDWWDRTPETMKSLGAPSAELIQDMIDELQRMPDEDHHDGTCPPEMHEGVNTVYTEDDDTESEAQTQNAPGIGTTPDDDESEPQDVDEDDDANEDDGA